MIPSLPTEIIDYLLTYLSDDIQSLRATSVLDRQWSEIARQYIFRTITLIFECGAEPSIAPLFPPLTTKSLDNLLLCFSRHPHLVQCVRTVSIQNTSPDKSLHTRISSLLTQMENVHSLDLENIIWSTMSPDLRYSIIHLVTHSSLTQLTATVLTIGAPDLIELLNSAPGLEVLRFDDIWVRSDKSTIVTAPTKTPGVIFSRLRSLHLRILNISGVFPHVLPPHTFTTLTYLDLENGLTDEHVVKTILKLPLTSLRHLELSRLTRNMEMKLPTFLKSLSVSKICDLAGLWQILRQVDKPAALERISIVVGFGRFFEVDEHVPPLEVIDGLLTSSHFHRLTAATFRFQASMAGCVGEDELFPCLRRSGVNVNILFDVSKWCCGRSFLGTDVLETKQKRGRGEDG